MATVKGRKFPRGVMAYHKGKPLLGMWYKDALTAIPACVSKVLMSGLGGKRYKPQSMVLEIVSRKSGLVEAKVSWAAGYISVECFDPRTRKAFKAVQKRWMVYNASKSREIPGMDASVRDLSATLH
jgi:hypothetical protein